jgi:two-component system cell cycle sensor histidine kinase PleC
VPKTISSILFTIADDGKGMTGEELHMATQPFGQVRSGHGDANEGTGLGLPISVALIKAHRGTFSLESQKGEGTVASFTIPTRAAAAAAGWPVNIRHVHQPGRSS